MVTNSASKFFFCILFVALFFISDASSVNKKLDPICEKTISCDNTGFCRYFCIILNDYQRWECNSKSGCCCYSDG
ncbi:uncharacterized protein DS421_13g403950 [Arachis hypogaea]|nr:uncharacterized protein DS421_13g403950 [Arachis hypogaea]